MAIKSVEVICLPCPKCAGLEMKIKEMVKSIGMINKIAINFEYKQTTSLRDISKYSLNPSQTPAILINGVVEFAGKLDMILVRRGLEAIHKSC